MRSEFELNTVRRDLHRSREPHYDLLIIGGGYAGAVTAIHALRRARASLRVAVIDPRARLGRGIAYGTRLDCHLLNTRAKRMSLRPHDEHQYTRWASARAAAKGLERMDENSFTPRGWFGDYVAQELNVAVADAGADFTHLRNTAVDCVKTYANAAVEHGPWRVGLSNGHSVSASSVVLALGNPPRRSGGFPGLQSPDARVLHAWDLDAHELSPDADVLIAGTGLTMVDTVLALEHKGHRGAIHAVSRHGLTPLAHTEDHGHVEPLASIQLRQLIRELRNSAEGAVLRGDPWQWSMDGARHQAQALWRGLRVSERRRFLRHARSYWDVHRHRVAPQIAQRIQKLRQNGRLIIHRGRIGEISATADALEVMLRSTSGTRTFRVARVISSLGFELDIGRCDSPLLQNLLRTGAARPGLAGLGLRTDELGRLQAASGRTWSSLYSLGGLRAGELWETTAAYEIQNQAVALAEHLARRRAAYPISV